MYINSFVKNAYHQMMINEANNNIIKMVNNWSKKYLNSSTDVKKVKTIISKILKIMGNEPSNNIDELTNMFLEISKYYEDNDKAVNDLTKILELI